VPREYRLSKAERDSKLDEQQEMFGRKEAFWVPDLHRTLSHLCSSCSSPSPISGECPTLFREPLQFIVIAVMSVIGGTFPDTYRIFYMTVN
jgi:hypothetical protein